MARRIPNPSVQNPTEEPVFNQRDSNTLRSIQRLLRQSFDMILRSHPDAQKALVTRMIETEKQVSGDFWPSNIACCNQTEEQFRLDREHGLKALSRTRLRTFSLRELRSRADAWRAHVTWKMETEKQCRMETAKLFSSDMGYSDKLLSFRPLQLLDRTKYDSALWEVGHSYPGKVYQISIFREDRSEQQSGSDKIVCQYAGDESICDVQRLSKSVSVNDKHFLGQRIGAKKLAPGRGLLRDHGLCMTVDILPSMKQVKLMGTNTENNLSLYFEESCIATCIAWMKAAKLDGKMTSQKPYYFTYWNPDKHKHEETVPKDSMFQLDDDFNQHKRKETIKRVPHFVIFPTLCLWILLVARSLTTSTHVQPLHEERGPMSVGALLLELFSLMVFVLAVAVMILSGAKFTRMHGAIFLIWAILMHVRLDDSISVLYLSILGIFFIGWYAICSWKGKNERKGEKLSGTVELGMLL